MISSILAQTNAVPSDVTLEPSGMIVMGASILVVLSLTVFCVTKILSEPNPESHHHAPLDIDTHDAD